MATTLFECTRVPEGTTCSVRIIGERDDVVQAAHDHMAAHGLTPGPELKEKVTRAVDEHQGMRYGTWGI
jgi:hypothetical protein